MQVTILASGSKGNAIFVEDRSTSILVDAGISAKRIATALQSLHKDIAAVDGIVITHEHGDHIKGLPTLCKKYALPLYARPATFRAMSCFDKLPQECLHPIEQQLQIGSLAIEAFNILHDAVDPVGYILCNKTEKCTVATDLGFVTNTVQSAIDGADILVLEANYDTKMLKSGSYPASLKQRILGNHGHLSNEEAAWALVRMAKKQPQVLLAHMSAENNCPQAVEATVQKIVEQQGLTLGKDLYVQLAKQETPVSCST